MFFNRLMRQKITETDFFISFVFNFFFNLCWEAGEEEGIEEYVIAEKVNQKAINKRLKINGYRFINLEI